MSTLKEIKAFLFDLDMTLIDSSYAIHTCTNMLAEDYGLKKVTREEVLATIGLPIEKCWEQLWGRYEVEWLNHYRTNFKKEETEGIRLFPNTITTLRTLRERGYKTAVVTNRKYPDTPIKWAGIDKHLDLMLGTAELKHTKPHPEPLLTACAALGVKPEEVIYTGDTDIDIKAARAAGIGAVGVTTGNFTAKKLEAEGAWKVINDLSELLSIEE